MNDVFIISTSHQLLQLDYAMRWFNLSNDNVQIILMCQRSEAKELLKKIKELGFKNVESFEYWKFKDIIRGAANEFNSFLKKIEGCKRLYLSQYFADYSLIAASVLKPSTLYVMDEGTASFVVVSSRNKKKILDWKLLVKSILYKKCLKFPKSISYFTQYDLGNISISDSIVKYSLLKRDNVITLDDNSILILGSSVVEVEVVVFPTYMSIIKKIKDSHSDKKIFYYAHRKEDENKLQLIKNMGISIVNSDQPFESHFGELVKTSSIYYSFYSPIFDNISKLYNNIPELRMIKFQESDVLRNKKVVMDIYYNYSKNDSVKLINIDKL